MTAKIEYDALTAEIAAIEKAHGGLYLVDGNVDAENCRDAGVSEDDAGYWELMLRNLKDAAGARAEEMGLDINALVGRVIY